MFRHITFDQWSCLLRPKHCMQTILSDISLFYKVMMTYRLANNLIYFNCLLCFLSADVSKAGDTPKDYQAKRHHPLSTILTQSTTKTFHMVAAPFVCRLEVYTRFIRVCLQKNKPCLLLPETTLNHAVNVWVVKPKQCAKRGQGRCTAAV